MRTDRFLPDPEPRPKGISRTPAEGSQRLARPANRQAAWRREPPGVADYWDIIWRRKGMLLFYVALCTGAALLLSVLQPKTYQARTTLEIQSRNENFLNIRDVDPTAAPGTYSGDSYLHTQVGILQSNMIFRRAAAKLGFEQSREAAAPAGAPWWRMLPGLAQDSAADQAAMPVYGDLKVRVAGPTQLVEIVYESTDPRFAADFANTLAQEYIEQSREARLRAGQGTGEWLKGQLEELKAKVEDSSRRLQAYAERTGMSFADDKSSAGEERLRQLQQELSSAQVDRVAKQSRYETAQATPPESLPEVLDSGPLRDYQQKLAELQREHAQLSSILTPTHYKVRQVQSQISALQDAFGNERSSVIGRIRTEYQAAQRREALLERAYEAQQKLVAREAGQALHYGMLRQELEANKQLYDSMLQRVKEAAISAAMVPSNIRVIDPAEPPESPFSPKPFLNTALGLLTGLFLGSVLIFVREGNDRSVRSPGDTAAWLKVPELGVIPSAESDLKLGSGGALVRSGQVLGIRNGGAADEDFNPVVWQGHGSLAAESFRATLASILFAPHGGDQPKVIVLTSPGIREGKTTATANLGIAMARMNRRVLLIDGDTRRPRLHRVFGLRNGAGLTDILSGGEPVEAYPLESLGRATDVPGLYVLPSGSEAAFTPELLLSPRLLRLLARCRSEFDCILIDTPPILQIADARLLARVADTVLLVLRSGQTTREAARAAMRRFADDATPILGTILNDWNASDAGYYGKQYYGYSHTTSGAKTDR